MKVITELIDNMEQELYLAKLYAQNFLIYNAEGNRELARRFKIMSNESIRHADVIHEVTIKNIQTLSESYTPPEEMLQIWNKKHNMYEDIVNWIKQIIK